MTAAALKQTSVLRAASGEPPLGRAGGYFLDEQGEIFEHDNVRYRSGATKIGVLELEGGKWLAQPPSFHVCSTLYDSRDAALRSAIARMIRRARKYRRNQDGEGTHWNEGFAGRVIEWALSIKPEVKQGLDQGTAADAAAASGHPGSVPSAAETLDWEGLWSVAWQLPLDEIVAADMLARGLIFAIDLKDRSRGYNPTKAGVDRVEALRHLFDLDETRRMLGVLRKANSEAAGKRPFPSMSPSSQGKQQCDTAGVTAGETATNSEAGVTDDSQGDHSGALNHVLPADPAIRSLYEANRARQSFPAGHTVSMTNPVVNGRMVTLGTCACGKVFSYPWTVEGRTFLMPAAIEAHWQTFDHLPEKVDGRGQPIEINGEERAAATHSSKPGNRANLRNERRRGGHPKAGDNRELANAPLPEPEPSTHRVAGSGSPEPGAGGPPAPISADASSKLLSADEPAPVKAPRSPDGAGSDISAAQICASMPAATMGGEPSSAPGKVAGEHHRLANTPAPDDEDDLSIEWPSYETFLEDKIVTAPLRGIEVARDALHPYLKPHCKDLVVWALRLGCSAIFANFGLHKTAMQLEWCRQLVQRTGQPSLCVVPLGVRHGFIKEALQLGMDVRFIRTTEELDDLYCEGVRYFLTNYESIREGKLDPNQFGACSLDEASVLRSYGSKTFQEFLPLFAKVTFKLVATATPSPNRYKELIHYSGFLGVMDTGLALTRFFQRNSEKAGDLTLYPHKEDEFWMWVHSWAAFLQKPSELGYSDEGYELPPLKLTWHEVAADHSKAEPERDGQGVMFRDVAKSLSDAAKSRRDSLSARIAKMQDLIAQDPQATYLIWHDLEAEREAIEAALPSVVTITGSMDIDERENRLHDFEEGQTQFFATKPVLSGSGSNFQYHCHKAIYLAMPGYGYKFNDFLQSLHRLQRFGQVHPVEVDIIYSEDERSGRAALEEKWALDISMRQRMSEIIRHHGLNTLPLRDALLRSIGIKRVEIKGDNFIAINNDAVAECRSWPDNSVDQIITSIPFSNHYEYSPSYNDFGHTDDNSHFWGQMDFLTAELLRMLKPGRLACIHVKDRVLFGSVTGEGVPTISPFHAEAIMHYRAHGFQYMGMIHVNTDVVRENNQTYRLGWSECCKDGTKMGVGSPEYVLLMRKRQSDRSKGYADTPVVKDKEEYSRARWQIDAHAFWRSSGNRLLTPEEFAACSAADLARLFAKTSIERIYDYEAHVKIGEDIDRTGTLPATVMAIAPGATQDHTWHDVNRMRTLNMLQQRKGAEMHLCPLQFDIVDRLIERYSNEGDLIFDPFGGLMTVPYRALLKRRRGAATELNATYFADGVHYLRAAEEKMAMPALFDLAAFDAANTPPSTV